MSLPAYEAIEHTADWALHVRGANLAALFEHAAAGMASLLVEDVEQVPRDVTRTLALEAFDAESLLVEWLSELAYWAEMEQYVFVEFDITHITETHLQATVRGGRADELHKHIKAVTYHNLAITPTAVGLETTVVFDV